MNAKRRAQAALLSLLLAAPTLAQTCQNTSVGFTPLNDLGAATYQGFQGGLYPGGLNTPPAAHANAGHQIAESLVPLDTTGAPSPAGHIVLVTIGMSNTSQESTAWIPMVNAFPNINPSLRVINGAQGGQTAAIIANPNAAFWTNVDARLAQAGLTPQQVQVIWLKEANAGPTLPFPADAQQLQGQLEAIANVIKDRYANTRLCFLSSRIYAGYATTSLNPEPWSYQSAFSVKWLIADQIAGKPSLNYNAALGPVESPWLGWSAYLWADGLVPRSDGLIWQCADFQSDGTHPSPAGAQKVGMQLMKFFSRNAASRPWFVACEADFNNDGALSISDFAAFQAVFSQSDLYADCNANGSLTIADFGCFQAQFAQGCP